METIYLYDDFKCSRTPKNGCIPYETDFFIGKCDTFVEGYRLIPAGSEIITEDGVILRGEMIAPWKDYGTLEAAQAEYEKNRAEMEDMKAALEAATADAEAAEAAYNEGVQEA